MYKLKTGVFWLTKGKNETLKPSKTIYKEDNNENSPRTANRPTTAVGALIDAGLLLYYNKPKNTTNNGGDFVV